MAKAKSFYVCSECGFKTIKWMGKCDGCGEWGTFEEENEISPIAAKSIKSSTNSLVNIQEKVVSFEDVKSNKDMVDETRKSTEKYYFYPYIT